MAACCDLIDSLWDFCITNYLLNPLVTDRVALAKLTHEIVNDRKINHADSEHSIADGRPMCLLDLWVPAYISALYAPGAPNVMCEYVLGKFEGFVEAYDSARKAKSKKTGPKKTKPVKIIRKEINLSETSPGSGLWIGSTEVGEIIFERIEGEAIAVGAVADGGMGEAPLTVSQAEFLVSRSLKIKEGRDPTAGKPELDAPQPKMKARPRKYNFTLSNQWFQNLMYADGFIVYINTPTFIRATLKDRPVEISIKKHGPSLSWRMHRTGDSKIVFWTGYTGFSQGEILGALRRALGF